MYLWIISENDVVEVSYRISVDRHPNKPNDCVVDRLTSYPANNDQGSGTSGVNQRVSDIAMMVEWEIVRR
jgi:hypothetical protein